MVTNQSFKPHSQSKLIHADSARFRRCCSFFPSEGLNLVDLEVWKTTAHFSSILTKFNKLFIRHVVYVRRVRVIYVSFLSWFFYCPLDKSLLFDSLLLICYLQSSLNHLFLLSPGLSFLHMHSHLDLTDSFDVITSTVIVHLLGQSHTRVKLTFQLHDLLAEISTLSSVLFDCFVFLLIFYLQNANLV